MVVDDNVTNLQLLEMLLRTRGYEVRPFNRGRAALEAAARTLSTPNAARLASFTHELVMEKVLDGQLDECGLTFRELKLMSALTMSRPARLGF